MEKKLNIAVSVDYDNIEIGLKSTLRREFDVARTLDALRERGDIVAKFAYANWSRHEQATRQMSGVNLDKNKVGSVLAAAVHNESLQVGDLQVQGPRLFAGLR